MPPPLPFAALLFAVVLGAGPLAACASTTSGKAAACDGRHRRPANPYGSVLTDPPAPQAQARAARLAATDPSFRPCRGRT